MSVTWCIVRTTRWFASASALETSVSPPSLLFCQEDDEEKKGIRRNVRNVLHRGGGDRCTLFLKKTELTCNSRSQPTKVHAPRALQQTIVCSVRAAHLRVRACVCGQGQAPLNIIRLLLFSTIPGEVFQTFVNIISSLLLRFSFFQWFHLQAGLPVGKWHDNMWECASEHVLELFMLGLESSPGLFPQERKAAKGPGHTL